MYLFALIGSRLAREATTQGHLRQADVGERPERILLRPNEFNQGALHALKPNACILGRIRNFDLMSAPNFIVNITTLLANVLLYCLGN